MAAKKKKHKMTFCVSGSVSIDFEDVEVEAYSEEGLQKAIADELINLLQYAGVVDVNDVQIESNEVESRPHCAVCNRSKKRLPKKKKGLLRFPVTIDDWNRQWELPYPDGEFICDKCFNDKKLKRKYKQEYDELYHCE